MYGFSFSSFDAAFVGALYVCCYGDGVRWVVLTTKFDGTTSLASLRAGGDTAMMSVWPSGCANILTTLENNHLCHLDRLTIFSYTQQQWKSYVGVVSDNVSVPRVASQVCYGLGNSLNDEISSTTNWPQPLIQLGIM